MKWSTQKILENVLEMYITVILMPLLGLMTWGQSRYFLPFYICKSICICTAYLNRIIYSNCWIICRNISEKSSFIKINNIVCCHMNSNFWKYLIPKYTLAVSDSNQITSETIFLKNCSKYSDLLYRR